MSGVKVLVVGAGPTGLALALWLTQLGVPVRIVDKTEGPGTTSRALALHARILEQYDQIGIAREIVAQGIPMAAANVWIGGNKKVRVAFGEMGKGISPFPFVLVYPQDAHEKFLEAKLEEAGVRVERRTELSGFEQDGERVRARLRRADGSEEAVEAVYIAGCDGARSVVRETVGAGFPGGTYDHVFYVADVTATGKMMNNELNVTFDTADFLLVFPLVEPGHARLVGTVKDSAVAQGKTLAWEDVSKSASETIGIEVGKVNWFSTYHVHHRVAKMFRARRAFLLGDAAHIHSPVGGQGMNTGIGDAINLAWKIAWVLNGGADPKVLDTYECERRAFAERLVATTDRAFTFIMRNGPLARFVRLRIAPYLLRAFASTRVGRRLMFRTVSQTNVNYRGCALSAGIAGKVHGGDRLPWVQLDARSDGFADNFEPLRSIAWQIHVYGERTDELTRYCEKHKFPLHVFAWRAEMGRAGFARNATYLVRPDGYVASATPEGKNGVRYEFRDSYLTPG
jgi:2-polyprenyl-6-methoxyphenol hydroxylase-like FAD-dependent oxidoreductase